MWAIPPLIVRHTRPISTFYSELAALVLFASLSLLVWVRVCRIQRPPDVALALSIPLGFVSVLFAQLALQESAQQMTIFIAIAYGLCCAMAIQVGYRISRLGLEGRALDALAYAAVIVATVSVAIAFLQAFRVEHHFRDWIAVYELQQGRRLFANMFQPNHLATVLSAGMAAGCYLFARKAIQAPMYCVILIVLGIGASLTGSRMAWLQGAFMVVMNHFLFESRDKPGYSRAVAKYWLTVTWPIGAMLLGAFIVSLMDTLLNLQLQSSASRFGSEQQLDGRTAIWGYALRMFLDHPLLGVGWGEFSNSQYRLADRMGPVEAADNAHNLILDVLSKTGLLGGILILVPLFAWLFRVVKALVPEQPCHKKLFALTFVGVVAIHAMLEYPQAYAFFLLPTCFLMGILEPNGRILFSRSMAFLISAVAACLLVIGLVISAADYRRAEEFYEVNGPLKYVSHPAFIFGEWARYGLTGLLELNPELIEQKITLHEHAIALWPKPEYIRRYAILLAMAGRQDSALLQVKRLISLSFGTAKSEYRLLLEMCDERNAKQREFKARLITAFGMPE
jgi:O-antigen ligase